MLHAMTKHYISRLTELRECDCWNQGRGTVSFKLPAGFLRARKHVSKGRPDAAVTNTSLPSSSYYDGKIVMICAMPAAGNSARWTAHLREGGRWINEGRADRKSRMHHSLIAFFSPIRDFLFLVSA
jgi:hypothetical protein